MDVDDADVEAYISGFGKKSGQSVDINSRYASIARPEFLEREKKAAERDEDDSDSESDSDDDEIADLPTTHELVFRSHEGSIRSLSVDNSGTRLASASSDSMVKLWDFNGMDFYSRAAFKSVEPSESHSVLCTEFSKSNLLVIPESPNPQIYTRDGARTATFSSGDRYIVDMKRTKGHVANMTTGAWRNEQMFLTAGMDSTVRIWDANRTKEQKSIIYLRNVKGFLDANWMNHNSVIAADDTGSVTVWDNNGPMLRPVKSFKTENVEKVTILPHNGFILTRGGGTLQCWDSRNLTMPVLQRSKFEGNCNVVANGTRIATGMGNDLHMLDVDDLCTIQQLPMPSNVTAVSWSEESNQIFVGLKSGEIHGLLKRTEQDVGMVKVIRRAGHVKHAEDTMKTTDVEMMGLNEEAFRQMEKRQKVRRKAAAESFGAAKPSKITEQTEVGRDHLPDPREELLKFAERAKTERVGFLKAYEGQDKVLSTEAVPEIDDDERRRMKKRIKIGK